ncbi:MAG: MBL fold metallo-hydrolase [Oscillospiraceae bacterium]|nr:MBL fold metallo-hydrolase [Oscillospiraceae bacterium]
MSRICTLASSSSGNSTYISGGSTALLIDAGTSCRNILQTIKNFELDAEQIKGILITHEHVDHVKALSVLLKKLNIPIYASKQVLEYIEDNITLPANTVLNEADENGFDVGEIHITPFCTPHDSVGSLGFRLGMPDNSEIGYATDIGEFNQTVFNGLKGCGTVVIESNYDDSLLDFGPYPYIVKKRIRSSLGHLSNQGCADAVHKLVQHGSKNFILAHLSCQNNLPLLAKQSCISKLSENGFVQDKDFTLDVAPKTGGKLLVCSSL